MTEQDEHKHHEHDVTVEIDRKKVTSPRETTAGALLERAGRDPKRRQLVKVEGRHTHKYAPEDKLTLTECEEFITVAVGPTPVS